MGERLVLGDVTVPFADAPATGEVVHPQRRRIRARHGLGHHAVAAEEGDEERERAHQVRRVVQQALSLGQVLVDQAEFALLEVADAAVDHLRRLRGRSRREVTLLDQGGPQAAAGCVERDAGTRDPTPDHQHVELLLGEATQRVGAAKGGHRSSLPHSSRREAGWPLGRHGGGRRRAAPSAERLRRRVGWVRRRRVLHVPAGRRVRRCSWRRTTPGLPTGGRRS